MSPIAQPDPATINEAAAQLRAARLVVFPTETVYGLGADAGSREAVERVYRLKGRPADHPLIVHVSSLDAARRWGHWSATADALARAFWPGPLTLVVERLPDAPPWASAGEQTIGLRVPSHPVAQALLRRFEALGGLGVAAPSANRFGRVSPTRAAHVIDDLGGEAPMVLDGGSSEVGLESTIVDLSRGDPVVLRAGAIGLAALRGVLSAASGSGGAQASVRVTAMPVGETPGQPAPRAPGTLLAHYAPSTPLELLDAIDLAHRIELLSRQGLRLAVWSHAAPAVAVSHWEPMSADAALAAHGLYDTLRRLDRGRFDRLLVEAPDSVVRHPPSHEKATGPGARAHADQDWSAVIDRLRRAAAGARPRS